MYQCVHCRQTPSLVSWSTVSLPHCLLVYLAHNAIHILLNSIESNPLYDDGLQRKGIPMTRPTTGLSDTTASKTTWNHNQVLQLITSPLMAGMRMTMMMRRMMMRATNAKCVIISKINIETKKKFSCYLSAALLCSSMMTNDVDDDRTEQNYNQLNSIRAQRQRMGKEKFRSGVLMNYIIISDEGIWDCVLSELEQMLCEWNGKVFCFCFAGCKAQRGLLRTISFSLYFKSKKRRKSSPLESTFFHWQIKRM